MNTLSDQLDELHEKARESLEKCEHGYDTEKCVPCALIASKERVRTNADFDREKREYYKNQEIIDISGFSLGGLDK